MFTDTMYTHGSHRYMQAEHSYEIVLKIKVEKLNDTRCFKEHNTFQTFCIFMKYMHIRQNNTLGNFI